MKTEKLSSLFDSSSGSEYSPKSVIPEDIVTKEKIKQLYIEAIAARDSIMEFWLDRCEDKEYGGFLTNFDSSGKDTRTPEKYLNTQCRFIWTFSSLIRRGGGVEYERLARQGVDFLIKNLWDEQYSGFYWKCKRDGSELDKGKIVYGESFAIYALSEYFLATKDPRGMEYASKTFDALQKYCADTLYGGYREYFNQDWTPESPGFGGGDRKTLDSHMHLMESFTVLYEASQQEIHRRKLKEIIDLIINKMIDHQRGSGLNQFDLAWNSVPALSLKRTWNAERFGEQPAEPTQTTSYGHNTELVWLLSRALEIGGFNNESYKNVMKQLMDHAINNGIDWQYGGVYRDGLRETGEPIVFEKEFWQNAEILVGMLDAYEIFGNENYLKAFVNVWEFCQKYMAIKDLGEWRTLCDRQGNILDANIGNPWKVSYHTGRSAMEVVDRLAILAK
jgi:mannobiose 2-epimerase